MTPKVLYDASAYIGDLRAGGKDSLLASRSRGVAVIYLSAVVAAELLRGATSARVLRAVQKLWREHEQAGRLAVPTSGDWYNAGQLLRKMACKYGYEATRQTRLLSDVLIALTARRWGLRIVTLNVADFERIAEFCPVAIERM